jgi:hypothetical protein
MLTNIVVRDSSFLLHRSHDCARGQACFCNGLIGAGCSLYGLVLNITRDSADTELVTAFKRVARKAHPDKGGTVEDSARLHASRDARKDALLGRRKPGRPSSDSTQGDNERGPRDENGVRQDGAMADPEEIFGKRRAEYRIRGQGVMLTYSGVLDQAQWQRFVGFVRAQQKRWGVKHWCATLEKCPKTENLHIHVYLQFRNDVDKTVKGFVFEGISPRADPNDLCGEGICRKRVQDSINRGCFYVWADKIGTEKDSLGRLCVEGMWGLTDRTKKTRFIVSPFTDHKGMLRIGVGCGEGGFNGPAHEHSFPKLF